MPAYFVVRCTYSDMDQYNQGEVYQQALKEIALSAERDLVIVEGLQN